MQKSLRLVTLPLVCKRYVHILSYWWSCGTVVLLGFEIPV